MVLTPTMAAESTESEGKSGFDSSDEEEGELDLSPFTLSWLELGTGDGLDKLGISGLPGCKFKDTWRSLENDIKCLKSEGVDEVFSLCTKGELNKYRVPWLLNEMTGADIVVHHYPFPDGQTPNMPSLLKMVDEIQVSVRNGRKPLVHCFGGLGRSCLVAVCAMLVVDESLEPQKAIDKIRELRGPGAIQSVKQYNYVCDFRQIYEEYKRENETEARSISR
ncbi:cyclin-dependent kinase inhibitor 3-like [Ruditapes philippinarum]|uniref:cyclin-dependent kinase inhibitor 3-like n=1 Tax=Ruditapes philippinarum TaxID=129788 RepID=UPI00295B4A4F|nr:cyclin-dependent kinase inhibitor 3-like [Ruditapes philippinarum]